MASLGGTPCAFMGSNSHKILALQQMLGYPDAREHSPWPGVRERAAMVAEVAAHLQQDGPLRHRIAERATKLGVEAAQMVDVLAGA
jgi:hypothetical protein